MGAMRNFSFVLILLVLLWGCVSVQLPSTKSSRSKDANFREPSSPFKDFSAAQADHAWISEKTGNTISYISECNNQNDPPLEQIESESLSSLSQLELIKSDDIKYNDRTARTSIHRGKLDGVPVAIALVIFKKNGCDYSLSYGGLESKFKQEENIFNKFVESFKVP